MQHDYEKQDGNEEVWKLVLIEGHPLLLSKKKKFGFLPSDPRCKLCTAPFNGAGGWFLKTFKGIRQSKRNPRFCNACDEFLKAYPGGIETPMTMMFVDIRNSTGLSSQMPSRDFMQLVSQLRNLALDAMAKTDGSVLEFIGDGVIAVWPPGIAGPDHAKKGIAAARRLLNDVKKLGPQGIDLPIGIGVHTGEAFLGTIAAASNDIQDISAFGHDVNLVARISAAASAGQAFVSKATCDAANHPYEEAQFQQPEMKGIKEPTSLLALN
ncbi:adenylate/guanylate cyclase domain-containing protein [Roseobacter sp. YSTF-M11]|uniref:Adenylate/guanylate cyclase domain-containing protein n=1 Tax=Roseobacter insulae TaxID=2859783 RepID=A0A9X1FUV1_9RHOB|nr:adenylate/guanylate cyclase domain-containing protein [Roseobacter insulae]MBW4708189.1 adenylate/guanylate cyclase domain-containing protein [Roseobacter insulae]